MPPGWHVTVDPPSPTLDPGDSLIETVTAAPPPGFTGNQVVNVNGFHSGGLSGGITLTVQVT